MGANLKEVRERIKSVVSTQQITKAMKMVSAAKLRRAQEAIVQLRPYADKLDEILGNIAENTDSEAIAPLTAEREPNKILIMVVTSNRGLCGAFNANIIKAAVQKIESEYAEQRKAGNITIGCVGKRGYDFFRKKYADCRVIGDFVDMFSDLSFEHISRLADLLMRRYIQGRYDRIEVAYGRFKNAGMQFPEMVQYLPVVQEESPSDEKIDTNADYLFEPNEDELLKHLVPSILQVTFQKFLLDTHASEHGARMTAMDKATENAEELLKDLRITYNKARQEAITKELSEIVGGAAALAG